MLIMPKTKAAWTFVAQQQGIFEKLEFESLEFNTTFDNFWQDFWPELKKIRWYIFARQKMQMATEFHSKFWSESKLEKHLAP